MELTGWAPSLFRQVAWGLGTLARRHRISGLSGTPAQRPCFRTLLSSLFVHLALSRAWCKLTKALLSYFIFCL